MELESLTEILSFGERIWMNGRLFTWFTVWNLQLPLGKVCIWVNLRSQANFFIAESQFSPLFLPMTFVVGFVDSEYFFQWGLVQRQQRSYTNSKREYRHGFLSREESQKHTSSFKKKLLRVRNATWQFSKQTMVFGLESELPAMLCFSGPVGLN